MHLQDVGHVVVRPRSLNTCISERLTLNTSARSLLAFTHGALKNAELVKPLPNRKTDTNT